MRINKNIATVLTLSLLLAGCGSGDNSVATTVAANSEQTTETVVQPEKKPETVEKAPSNWYIRVVAEDPVRDMKTLSAQLGEVEESDAVEKHTLKALTPFGSSYLDVVFRDPAGVEAGDYKVNFHQYQEASKDSWTFTVRTDNANADILLSWRGLYVLTPYTDDQGRQRYKEYRSVTNPLIQQMKLVDVTTGQEIPAVVEGKVQTYVFNMDGETERTFQWIVETEPVNLDVQTSKTVTMQAESIKKDMKTMSVTSKVQKAETFDLSKPPMIKEDMNAE